MITTAIESAVRLARDEPLAAIPPFTGTLVLRDSVAPGPYAVAPLKTLKRQ
ncbi:Transcriptional regulator, LacI family [Cronobacter universalis NCTC 9529]|nr:Transcriptional regulator, LacI family [Cronobacter universalis NCTC 9529]